MEELLQQNLSFIQGKIKTREHINFDNILQIYLVNMKESLSFNSFLQDARFKLQDSLHEFRK